MSPLIATLFIICLFMVSFLAYSTDKSEIYFEGKQDSIPAPKYAEFLIKIVSYLTPVLAIASLHYNLIFQFSPGSFFQAAGCIVSMIGMTIFLNAKSTLGRHYSPCFNSYIPEGVVKSGIYSLIRHPIYTGNLIIIFGVFLLSGSWLVFMLLTILYALYSRITEIEENALSNKHRDYIEYLKTTGRFFPAIFR